MATTIANGNKMVSRFKCPDFRWVMQGHEFNTDLQILKLGDCHVVLGVDWMKMVSPFIFDFNKLEVTFGLAGKRITLTGSWEEGECKLVMGRRMQSYFSMGKLP